MARWRMTGVAVSVLAAAVLVPTTGAGATTTPPPDSWPTEYGGSGNATENLGATALTPATAAALRLRWTRDQAITSNRAPSIVDGVGYEVVNQGNVEQPSSFEAFSPTTGATLWTTPLPVDGAYHLGVSVVGHVAVMSFDGFHLAGGVSAVDLTTHRLLWSAHQPAALNPVWGTGTTTAGPIVTDGIRVYMFGGTNRINTFRLSDGALLWDLPNTSSTAQPDGIALGNKVVYTGGEDGVFSYDAATGHQLWSAPGLGAPVVAGGRVLTVETYSGEVMADAAAGCGAARCGTLWNTTLPGNGTYVTLGGVDGSTGYATMTNGRTGSIVRFSTVSGRALWSAPIGPDAVRPVRGASTVWTVAGGTTLVGFSTTATGTTPLRSIVEPADQQEGSQELAVAGGTVFVRSFPQYLTAYGPA